MGGGETKSITAQDTAFLTAKPQTLPLTTSGIITSTTGTIDAQQFTKFGMVGMLHLVITSTSSVAAGANVFSGNVAVGYRPRIRISGACFYGSVAIVFTLNTDGNITGRVIGGTLPANSQFAVGLTYLLNA